MKINRTKNAIKGTIYGLILKIVQILFSFVIRTIFIHSLGVEYLGLNSLFTSILQVLNLAELGVGSVLVFNMYKPIAENNKVKICQLMKVYKTYYRMIGLVIFGVGLIILPFIPKMIKGGTPESINIYVIYIMNLIATSSSYWLFAYRNSLYNAHQRVDVISYIQIIANVIKYFVQIVTLVVFKNYYLYLLIEILNNITINIITAVKSKREYPEYNPEGTLSKNEKKQISNDVRNLFTAKIGGIVNNSVDSVIISAFLGLRLLAMYQNYYYIVSTIIAFIAIFFKACTAGIGNRLIVQSNKDNEKFFYNLNYICFFVLNFCCASMLCLCQPFMEIWIGKDLMLSFGMVILFTLYLYAEVAPRTMIVFKDAGGIWKEDRFRPITVAIVNLTINLVLVKIIGLYGILGSTIFSMLFVGTPWLIHNINKTLFSIKKELILKFIKFTIVIGTNCLVTYLICSNINVSNLYITIVIRGLICLVVPNLMFLYVFKNSDENIYLMQKLKSIYKKIKGGIKA